MDNKRANTIYKISNFDDSCGGDTITEMENPHAKHRSLVADPPDEYNQERNQS